MPQVFSLFCTAFDWLNQFWESPRSARWISNLVVGFFAIGLLVPLLQFFHLPLPFPHVSPFFAVEIAFTLLLIFEILGLIFLLPRSVADSIGKQFEIISLLLLRNAFKEIGNYMGQVSWDAELLIELLPMVVDGFGSLLIFGMTALFYQTQKHQKITQNEKEQAEFIAVKKIISVLLILIFLIIGIVDIVHALNTGEVLFSIQSFYTLLIFTDIFILIFSLRYSSKYFNLFRYSSFALATLFLRLAISASAYYNVLLALISGALVLGVSFIYNGLLLRFSTSLPKD
ncbi:MAG: hypothetical protein FJX97_00865 [Bacteroidetes bacterium]|nr:hypothetical protein [Bacteroidota bacterium]